MSLRTHLWLNRFAVLVGCVVGAAGVLCAQAVAEFALGPADGEMQYHWGMLSERDMQVLLHRLDVASDEDSVVLMSALVSRLDGNRERARQVLTALAASSAVGDGARAIAFRSLLTDYAVMEAEDLQIAREWLQSYETYGDFGEVPAAAVAIETVRHLGGPEDIELLELLIALGVDPSIGAAAREAIDSIRSGDSLDLQPRHRVGD